jgi:uncharacterized protein (TIGR04255 family)
MRVSAFGTISIAPPFRLKRAELAQVLCQIRFSPILRLQQDDAIIPFQEAIRAEYSGYTKQSSTALLVTPEGVQQQSAGAPLHRFEDPASGLSALLATDFVALEATAYVDIENFASRLVQLAGAVKREYEPAQMTRMGLRFINELRLQSTNPKADMLQAISPALLGPAGAQELHEPLQSAQQVLELAGEGHRMIVRHGLFPQGGSTVASFGGNFNPDPRPFYLLDIDVFSEERVVYSVEGVETRLREFNGMTRTFFAWAVQEKYRRAVLGQEDEAQA